MDCKETARYLDAYVDGELDVVHQHELRQHLETCPACSRRAEEIRQRNSAIREALPRFAAPASLRERVRASIATEDAVPDAGGPRDRVPARAPSRVIMFPIWRVAGLAASLAIAIFAGYRVGYQKAVRLQLFDEAIADHVRSLQANHLMDVVSTDQHTVKPWFAGKIDFSAPVVDLGAVGFPLVGGRLEHFDGRTAAALVYRRRQHAINVLVWPATTGAVSAQTVHRDGYTAESWSAGDLNFIAVSEIPAADLHDFTSAYRSATR